MTYSIAPPYAASGVAIRSALQLAAVASYPAVNAPQTFTDGRGNVHTYRVCPESAYTPTPWMEPDLTAVPSVTMSKDEIALRLENIQLATKLADLARKFADMEAATRYGEQCDEDLIEHLSQMQPSDATKTAPFPANALRHRSQRIGLFTPHD